MKVAKPFAFCVAVFGVALLLATTTEVKAGGDTACCGALGASGPWGGGTQTSFCMHNGACDSGQTNIQVSYGDTSTSCPKGSYSCLVYAEKGCCGWGCQSDAACSRADKPSCCSGSCGTVSNYAGLKFKVASACDPLAPGDGNNIDSSGPFQNVTAPACCSDTSILVPSSLQSAPVEWTVSYGNRR